MENEKLSLISKGLNLFLYLFALIGLVVTTIIITAHLLYTVAWVDEKDKAFLEKAYGQAESLLSEGAHLQVRL